MNDWICIDVNYFNLKYTVECGQCFRWNLIENSDTYVGVISDRVIKIKQEGNKLYVRSNKNENLENVVKHYFDLNKDYGKIEEIISKVDTNIQKAVKNTSGIRILNQDFFEMVISYIISANNNILRISRSVNDISKKYGTKVIFDNEEYYLFPTLEQLKNVTEDEFRHCGVGFRARYLKYTIKELENGKIDMENISSIDTQSLRQTLMTLQGVGPKVADCILLFACGRGEVFPIDVWVERVMCMLYFKTDTKLIKKKDILDYANEKFGEFSGIIQQHLFYNIREKMI